MAEKYMKLLGIDMDRLLIYGIKKAALFWGQPLSFRHINILQIVAHKECIDQ